MMPRHHHSEQGTTCDRRYGEHVYLRRFLGAEARRVFGISFLFLLALDAVHILLHSIGWLRHRPVVPRLVDLGQDWSLPTVYTYATWAITIALLTVCWQRTRTPVFTSLAAVFAVLLADDALQLHEKLGYAALVRWKLPALPGLRQQDTGELVVFAVMGVIVVGLLAVGMLWTSPARRSVGWWFIGCLVALAVVGVIFDMAHIAVLKTLPMGRLRTLLGFLVGVAEDGGQLMVASVILATSLGLVKQTAIDMWGHPSSGRRPSPATA